MSKALIIGIKQTATYWLGITHYDTGRFETAVDWLKQRTLDSPGENPWKPGARYNLSRSYEALGDLETARKTLLLDDSPQKHGNLLRARYLREKLERQQKSGEARPVTEACQTRRPRSVLGCFGLPASPTRR